MKTIEEHANELYDWLTQTAVTEGSASIIKQLPGKLEQIKSEGRVHPTYEIPESPGLYWWRESEKGGWVLLNATYNARRIELEFKIVNPTTPIQSLPVRWFEDHTEGQWIPCREPEVQG